MEQRGQEAGGDATAGAGEVTAVAGAAAAAAAAAAVDRDVPCAMCGYNLRSLGHDALCPECSAPVERSLERDNALWQARPAWLRSLGWGVRLMLLGQLGVPAMIVCDAILENPGARTAVVLQAALVGVTVVYAAGAWLLTRRERLFASSSAGDAAMRLTVRLGVLGPPLALGLLLWSSRRLQSPPLWLLLGLASLVVPGVLATYLYLRRLAVRVLSRRMAEYAAIVAWGGALAAGGYLLVLGLAFAGVDDSHRPFEYVMLAIAITVLLFYLWSTLVLVLFAVAFAKAARGARALWGASTAAP